MDFEATDEEWREERMTELLALEKECYSAMLRVHENRARLEGCETCAQNEAISLRCLCAEGELQALHKSEHYALFEVYQNSGREQLARAERGLPGCEACCANEGISRRCMSTYTEGPPIDNMQFCDDVHAIEVFDRDGEHGISFCRTCSGLEGFARHKPIWDVFRPILSACDFRSVRA
jgi:hypothetical protein